MSEAASSFDGYQLTRIVDYSNWDADVIQGCVCDYGYFGYDCSLRECPRGDNFMTTGQRNEKMKLQCNATSGTFYIQFRGDKTQPLPYNAGFGYLEHELEALAGVSDVDVSINSGFQICAASNPITTIHFKQDFGNLPPARAVSIDLGGTAEFVTEQTITCQNCTNGCSGGIFLSYDKELTTFIPHDATSTAILNRLQDLSTLTSQSDHGTITIEVNQTNHNSSTFFGPAESLCTTGYEIKTTITMKAAFGNLYDLELTNSVYHMGTVHDVTLTTQSGTKENDFCSSFGWCNTTYAHCECYMNASAVLDYIEGYRNDTSNQTNYYYDSTMNITNQNVSLVTTVVDAYSPLLWDNRYGSSDGYGNQGTRGDCGYQMIAPRGCPGTYDAEEFTFYECNDQGRCNEDTYVCECYEGWLGPACDKKSCPVGKAWFDEANSRNNAHAPTECSNMGTCDYTTGNCKCREGFTGRACDRLGCVNQCNGVGTCLPLQRLAELALGDDGDPLDITYGIPEGVNSNTWDHDMIYQCHCDTPSYHHPYNGPKAYIHGVYVDNPHLGGYHGWDCSRRYCPYGDDPMTTGGLHEIQSVSCNLSIGNFSLTFRGQSTEMLQWNTTVEEMQAALLNLTTIGNVSVTMRSNLTSCDLSGNDAYQVTFLKELGDVPSMTADPDAIKVVETQQGTKEFVECSNRGFCNEETGFCECLHPYAFSDGDGNYGILDNCGRKDGMLDSV
eukprot:CAMPEP_0117739494 /NCGR_PEP_ID=MMETSP0947-20121206/3781_1 /TAXON_ID=44440 /ORGANISM="Chattonella subsalsa, Strain CCMP2191" /LENGTH=726 /DNA_ID=CAMNT_0005555431 /DNA_START=640 /DNA_END=2820 /DNA_ORIENTATION=+